MNTNELKNMLGDLNVLDKPAEREMYSHDIGDIPPLMTKAFFKILPDVVVQPKNIDQIMKVVSVANQLKIPVTTRGAASWGFGGVIPTKSGIVIDLSPFRKILSLDTAAKTVTVEAGARWSDIDILAKKNGLCLMTYPSSKFSTVGGWISTGGYGINSFKFGHLSNQIIAIKVVTGTGELRELTSSDSDFKYFVSTEGEFGIIVEAKIKLRQVPESSFPHLLYFSNDEQAFTFVSRFAEDSIAKGYQPNSIRFLDSNQLSDINQIMHGDFFKKTSGVILEFGSARDDAEFSQFRALNEGIEEAPQYVANYLWNERLFGMKTKRLGPTILASEIIIPMKSAAKFIAHAKKIGHSYGVEVAIDSHIISKDKALIMATFLCDSRKRKYVINVPLVAMLTKTAISLGAEPYGLGLWNAAFVNSLYPGTKKTEFKAFKAKTDPNHILNKGKSFSPGGNFLAGIVFSPAFFVNGMNILVATSPVVGKIAT
ncbi:MAG TPA: FAD-binding oxidoreductase, partial [Dehalococcoidales bacterium]|nr:FAD-binding oxidoreductase [Dehalococcoidales bacterium]